MASLGFLFKKASFLSCAIVGTAVLFGCGEDSTSEKIVQSDNSGMASISGIGDLPKCTTDNDGVQVFIKSENSIRICSGGEWYGVKGFADLSCSSEELADSTGIKILCNGDSVGVVLNGKKGELGETGAAGLPGANCTVETLADNSGLKVLCGGDSVGVVLNGAKGATGDDFEFSDFTDEQLAALKGDPGEKGDKGKKGDDGDKGATGAGAAGASCNLVNKDCLVHVACGNDTVSLDIYADNESCTASAELDEEAIATNLEGIGGSSQKGPFLTGSEVVANELLNGRSLTQTGKTFVGKILSDKGDFNIKTVSLTSQYATLSAKGYYLNEVTGKPSNSQITLTALTNLRGRAVANINLLTHLENERAQYLVINGKKTVPMAKKIAETEVFKLFHIDAKNFSGYSEDLNVAGSSDADAALLAMSILLQGDRSEAELSALLTSISKSMEESGEWDDETTKIEIADWAAGADSAGLLPKFRENVAGWGLSQMVAKFEPFVRNYWYETLKIGSCSSDIIGTVVQPSVGKRSGSSKTRFTCVDSSDAGVGTVWRASTNLEKDTYQWVSDTADGAIKNGSVTGMIYVFDSLGIQTANSLPGWRQSVPPEEEFGGCKSELFGTERFYRGAKDAGLFGCGEDSHKWVKLQNSWAIDTLKWVSETDGYAKWGDSVSVTDAITGEVSWTRTCYVYDESLSPPAYRVGNDLDCSLGLMGCTKAVQALDKVLYSEIDENYYWCKDNHWELISSDVEKNTHGMACSEGVGGNNGSVIAGTADSWYYVCDNGVWRKAAASEYVACHENAMCTACTDKLQDVFDTINDLVYVCDRGDWRIANEAELERRLCVSEVSGGEMFYGERVDWVCKDDAWQNPRLADYSLEQWNEHVRHHTPEGVTYGELVDKRDGRTYRTVKLSGIYSYMRMEDQVWMAENLKYDDSSSTMNLIGNSWCYNNNPENCEVMGRYYSWTAAMDLNKFYQGASAEGLNLSSSHRGICPEGWHLPSIDDWSKLRYRAISSMNYHLNLQVNGLASWPSATNSAGFSAAPTGYYYPAKLYKNNAYYIEYRPSMVDASAYFWTSTANKDSDAFSAIITKDELKASTSSKFGAIASKSWGYTVRCVQD